MSQLDESSCFYLLPPDTPFRAASAADGTSQTRGQIGAAAAGLHHRHRDAGSQLHLQPTPQLAATLDP